MAIGYLSLVLHAHLPFVRHPEYDYFLEEHWLFEAITETYIPLLMMYEGLIKDGYDFRITMSLTPPLIAMLKDPLLQAKYEVYIKKLIELSEKEIIRTEGDAEFNELARYYNANFIATYEAFSHKYKKDLVNAFKYFQDIGVLEIITCGATHGLLPLLNVVPQTVRAQIMVAANDYAKHFGRKPRGIWLPECAYFPGLDKYLAEAGIDYFITDTHGILHAHPKPRYGGYAPIVCPSSGVGVFCRDRESSEQVWSSQIGYPGDYDYREYYRDIGYDLDFEYIKPYIQPDGTRKNTGIKYYKVTGPSDKKEPYNVEAAKHKAFVHAGHFLFNRQMQINYLFNEIGRKPIVLAPYDAELYGHWWYEGPMWLNFLLRKSITDQKDYQLTTPGEYLANNPINQKAEPAASSWGAGGYYEFWLNPDNDMIYRYIINAGQKMVELAYCFREPHPLQYRALNQAARELLLAQSSDWAFIMKTGTMVEYAVKRTKQHLSSFFELYSQIRYDRINEEYLGKLEYIDNIFPDIDYGVYRDKATCSP